MNQWWLPWAVYLPMGAAGAAWASLAHGSAWKHPLASGLLPSGALGGLVAALSAFVVAAVTVALTRVLVTRTIWARQLHLELRGTLIGTSTGQIAILALTSALGEELFFRAALQPTLGLAATSVLFGVVHVAPNGNWLTWAVWASVMGLVFGLLYRLTGTLLAPALAHALINYENMQYICNYDPTPLDSAGRSPT